MTVIRKLNRRLALPAAAIAVILIAAAAVIAPNLPPPPALAQSNSAAPANVAARNGANIGEAIVSWTPNAAATGNRIGWANISEVQAAQAAGNWLEAFNFAEIGGDRDTYTVKRLEPGVQHAFIVATLPGYAYSEWVFLTTTTAPTPTPAPASTPNNANCLPIQSVGTYSGTGDSADTVIQLNAGLYRFTTTKADDDYVSVHIQAVAASNPLGEEDLVGNYTAGNTGGADTARIRDDDRDWYPQAGAYILKVDATDDWTVKVELIQAH